MANMTFDFVKDLSFEKKDLTKTDPKVIKEYQPSSINRAFMMGMDTIMYANEMNMYPDLDKQMQHDFYLFALRKRKRYNKWTKKEKDDIILLVCKYFNFSERKAKDAMRILSREQLDMIQEKMTRGIEQ